MQRSGRVVCCMVWAISAMACQSIRAEQLFQFRNGLVIEGSAAEIATLKDGFGAAAANQMNVRPIWLINDGLRRTYVHGKGMIANTRESNDLERPIEIWQPKPLGGKPVGGLGTILGVSPFNEYGRRVMTIRGPEGPVQVVQGITELTSRYAKLVALKGKPTLSWDMRVATRSLATSDLNMIFQRRMNLDDLNDRLEVVRFYISAERYDDARQALEATIKAFKSAMRANPNFAKDACGSRSIRIGSRHLVRISTRCGRTCQQNQGRRCVERTWGIQAAIGPIDQAASRTSWSIAAGPSAAKDHRRDCRRFVRGHVGEAE